MPDTVPFADKVDPGHTAVLVIDYEDVFVAESGALDQAGMVAPQLAVVEPHIVNLIEQWGAEFAGRVGPEPGDITVTKHRFGAFKGTDLDLVLRVHGVWTVVVCGVVTHVCMESTVREAFFRDCSCVVPEDAAASWQPEWHKTSLAVMSWGFAEVVPTGRLQDAWHLPTAASSPAFRHRGRARRSAPLRAQRKGTAALTSAVETPERESL